MADLLRRTAAGTERDLPVSRASTCRLLQRAPAVRAGGPAAGLGPGLPRRYDKYVAAATTRMTPRLTLPQERRLVGVTDPLPTGVEPVDGGSRRQAADLASDGSQQADAQSWEAP
jgi:hypothetical protein